MEGCGVQMEMDFEATATGETLTIVRPLTGGEVPERMGIPLPRGTTRMGQSLMAETAMTDLLEEGEGEWCGGCGV